MKVVSLWNIHLGSILFFRWKTCRLEAAYLNFLAFDCLLFRNFLIGKRGIENNIFTKVIQNKVETFNQRGHDATLKKAGQPEVNND